MSKSKNLLNKLNPIGNSLVMGERVYDCQSFTDSDHPLYRHGLIFPCGLVEVSGTGTLLSEKAKQHAQTDTIDKTLYFYNPDVTECEVVTSTGDVVNFAVLFASTVFSKFMLRAHNIEKIIFKEAS